ncbi:hypothetical protein, partial [Mycobacterium tuberculosis]|uniref:hypothetical protein n=1 Tax=Mycobacterium tuberculosis TaxID=1773 RepID=UPI001587DE8C
HRVLSPQAINRLHPVLDKMTIHPHLKEHLVWSYFYHRLSGLDSLSNELMQAMLNEYSQNKFLAVESLFINALKSDIISLKQLEIIEKFFSSKAFIKESAAFKCREIVRAGNKLKPV